MKNIFFFDDVKKIDMFFRFQFWFFFTMDRLCDDPNYLCQINSVKVWDLA